MKGKWQGEQDEKVKTGVNRGEDEERRRKEGRRGQRRGFRYFIDEVICDHVHWIVCHIHCVFSHFISCIC